MDKKVAVVTGGNKGIGFAVCRALAEKDFHVILTSRHVSSGQEAARKLERDGLDVSYFQLDVTLEDHIAHLKNHIEHGYGRLDVLVNNAGIFLDPKDEGWHKTKLDTLEKTLHTNTFGPFLLCEALLPLMKKNHHGRIINISSGLGQLSDMQGHYSAYRISKAGLNAVTRIIAAEARDTDILVNSMCPGWVKTDMGGADAERTPAQGAETAVWLAMLPKGGPTGGFFRDCKPIEW